MSDVIHIRLLNIPERMVPGDVIDCTVNDAPHKAEFVQYAGHRRFAFVRVYGLREIANGKFAMAPLLGDFDSFVNEFIINNAPGCAWHRTAGMSAEVAR